MPDCGRDTLSALGQLLPAGQAHAPSSSSDGDPASAHSRGGGTTPEEPINTTLTSPGTRTGACPFAAAEGEWSRGLGGGTSAPVGGQAPLLALAPEVPVSLRLP